MIGRQFKSEGYLAKWFGLVIIGTALGSVGSASAGIVADYTFDHLSDLAEGAAVVEGRRAQDESGNRHHGQYIGGTNPLHVTYLTPSGTPGLDFADTTVVDLANRGAVSMTPGLTENASPDDDAWFGAGPTPAIPNFTAGQSVTMEAIINFRSASSIQAVLANNGSSGSDSQYWWRARDSQKVNAFFSDGFGGAVGPNIVVGAFDDDWHHIAIVLDRTLGEARTYFGDVTGGALINTTLFTSGNIGAIGNQLELIIGQFVGSASRDFDGLMDRVVISDEALAPGSFAAAVPEPASLSLLLVAIGCSSLRRSKK